MLVELVVNFGEGQPRRGVIATTDECGALFSKVLAWDDRRRKSDASKDAFDVWRALRLCRAAGVGTWPDVFGGEWREILRTNFGSRSADGCRALACYVGNDSAKAVTEATALVKALKV